MISTIQSFFVPNTSQISRQSQQITEEKEKKEKDSLTCSIAQKSIKPFEKQEGEIINSLDNSISFTVLTDYLPPLSYSPFNILSILSNLSKIVYKVGITIKENSNPKHKTIMIRNIKIINYSFYVIIYSAFFIHSRKMTKDKELVEAPCYRSNLSIQKINEEVKKITTNALEELLECYKRIIIGGFFKEYCGVMFNSDKSKYFDMGEDAEKIHSFLDGFDYMIKIASPELTKNMVLLKERGCKAYNHLNSQKFNESYFRVKKFTIQIMDEIIDLFLNKDSRALLNNRTPPPYPYNLSYFQSINLETDKDNRRTIIKMAHALEFFFEDFKKSIKEYEVKHGELQI